jgi:polyketide synthase 7
MAQAGRLHAHLAAGTDLAAQDVGFSLATTRAAFDHRAVVVASGRAEFLAGLEVLAGGNMAGSAGGEEAPTVVRGHAGNPGRTVFVFSGQGGQWAGMAAELLDASAVFAEQMAACADALRPYVDWSLVDVVRGRAGAPGLGRVDVVQPALFAVMVSLAALWRSCGVEPDAVVGHSQGEIAAAYVAGGLSLGDAAKVVALRAQAGATLVGSGCLASVALPVEQVEARLAGWRGRIGVAAVNGPTSTVVSGELGAVAELTASCEAAGIRTRTLPTTYASHSPQVEAIRSRVLEALTGITPHTSQVAFYSTVTGGEFDTAGLDPRLLVPQPAGGGVFRAGRRCTARAGARGVRRDEPAPGAGGGGAGKRRAGWCGRGGGGVVAAGPGWAAAFPDLGGRGVRAGSGGGLGGGVRRVRWAAGGAADVRLPAASVLACAGGGCRRPGSGRGGPPAVEGGGGVAGYRGPAPPARAAVRHVRHRPQTRTA